MINRVFVYGTLMSGESNHPLISDYVTSITPAYIKGSLYDLPYGYPALLPGNGIVFGELIELHDIHAAIMVMDDLEDYNGPGQDNLYERETVEVYTIYGDCCTAWVYRWSSAALPAGAKLVPPRRWGKRFPHLYFTYGSCLDKGPDRRLAQSGKIHEFCPLAIGELPGYRFVLHKEAADGIRVYANLIPESGSSVVGLIYQVSDAGLRYLDARKGHPDHYQRVSLAIKLYQEDLVFNRVFTYLSKPQNGG